MQIDAIILAGGAGKRLWPQSRKNMPKHLLKLKGEDSLLYLTIMRTMTLCPERIIIITNKDHADDICDEIKKVKRTEEYLSHVEKQDLTFRVIKEPESRNTAPAVALGAYMLNNENNDNIAVMFPSDHLISNNQYFLQTIKSAYSVARKGYIVTLGIAPNKPATGYGYIETENVKGKKWYTVNSFKEKPDIKLAEKYYKNENYYFNSGMLVFKPSDLIAEFDKYMPELSREMKKIVGIKFCSPEFEKTLGEIYNNIESEAIDYGILEKSKNVAVVPASFSWSDVGTWESLYDAFDKDENGNIAFGDVVSIDSHGTLVKGNKRLIALIGANDLIVVDTDDALLICNKNSAEDVKKLVNILEENKYKKLV